MLSRAIRSVLIAAAWQCNLAPLATMSTSRSFKIAKRTASSERVLIRVTTICLITIYMEDFSSDLCPTACWNGTWPHVPFINYPLSNAHIANRMAIRQYYGR